METRDQWYKPNLLYNIHYRPPQTPEPPKMIVETVQFNPSVCTCGEHGCQPQYRMEKRVLWTNKEACNARQEPKVNEREKKNEYRESKFEKRITKHDRKIGGLTESKQVRFQGGTGEEYRFEESDRAQMGLKVEIDCHKKFHLMIEGDGYKCGAAERFKEKMPGGVAVRGGYKAKDVVKEKGKVEGDTDKDDEKEKKKKDYDCKDIFGYSESNDYVCIDEEASNTNNSKENNSNGRGVRDNSEGRNSERLYGEKIIGNDKENAIKNNCMGGGKGSKEDQIDKDTTTGEVDVAVDSDGAGDDWEYCSKYIILMNDSVEFAESCIIESLDDGFEDVEVASSFGIMTIYCNSELHSWSFDGEDA